MNCISERESKNKEIEYWRMEYEKASDEMRKLRCDNEALKEAVVRMALKMVGVTN